MKEALFYEKIENSSVHCRLCPHNCKIRPDGLGACRARKNIDGTLFSMNYGRVASISVDPIEKKPLYHFHPGTAILSAGTFGCNLKCSFCQNWSIAHKDAHTYAVSSEQLVEKALDAKKLGNIGIAYTYNEPSIWYEFVLDTAKLARKKGLANVLVTNGFISRDPLLELLPYIDAMNIDVKAYTSDFYAKVCGGALDTVKATVEASIVGCHVEITTLVIPGLNDSEDEIGELSRWLASISPEIPLHLTRFFPNYRMQDVPPTPVETLKKAGSEASKYLKHVHLGNVW
jgi:pyruvate formate lyase activating enzyme